MPKSAPDNDPLALRLGELRSRNEGALVAYLTGGAPTPKDFLSNASALIEGGADILEIGIPFSDPIADGPIIQAASQTALTAGTTPKKVLALAKELSGQHDLPLVLLSYYNPILAMGAEHFIELARKSGVSGLVIPDNPIGEDPHFHQLMAKHGLDMIPLAAPNTPHDRLVEILEQTTGFLYLVSLYGVTGPRKELGSAVSQSLRRIRSIDSAWIPVLVGFGVSTPSQVTSLIAAGADGAIVGSAFVRITQDHAGDHEKAESLLKTRASELKKATRKSI